MTKIKSSLDEKIKKFYQKYYRGTLNIKNWQPLVWERLNEEKIEVAKIEKLQKLLGDFKGKKILDVGCGAGGFVIAAMKKKLLAYGIDPAKKAIEICEQKAIDNHLPKRNFLIASAEKIPFKDNTFAIVYCFTVLEHVNDVEKSVSEIIRVVKKGGKIYINTPNSLSFYEGHYKIFWLPLFPKKLANLYLSLRKRPTKFLSSVNYLTPNFLKKLLSKYNVSYYFIDHELKRGCGILNSLIYFFYKIFMIDTQIELVIEK